QAQGLILSGQVATDGQSVLKAGQLLSCDANLSLKAVNHPFVSRGGVKLAKALQQFTIEPMGKVCLDVGASTGGFTDCLLQNGADLVYAVDVGYGQLAWKLRQDSRVICLERKNFRHLSKDEIQHPIELAVVDVSFISLAMIFPRLSDFLSPEGATITLVKPQFEVGRGKVGKGGVVRDATLHIEVLLRLKNTAANLGFTLTALDWSPIRGPQGNIEYLALWQQSLESLVVHETDIASTVALAHNFFIMESH
ncbi:MAG: TlyA family RNA methyltransferase, partial [Symbiobacteriaceae bacterium]|nr:TlyA family RNA methyltransferase [Symbiobacteriaceae bacterium]